MVWTLEKIASELEKLKRKGGEEDPDSWSLNKFHWGEKVVGKFYTTKMRDEIAAVLK